MKIQTLVLALSTTALISIASPSHAFFGMGSGGSDGDLTCKGTETLKILSGSENEPLKPLLSEFEKTSKIDICLKTKGSVDIMLDLQSPTLEYNVIWPANSIWITIGDTQKRVRDVRSTSRTPIVFALKKSVAQKLGWIGKEISINDILDAAKKGQIKYAATSATQSNSGASWLIAAETALSGKEVLDEKALNDPKLQARTKELASGIVRTSGSSNWLVDLYLNDPTSIDGLVNYEALVIELNQELTRRNMEPLYVVYPTGGTAIADLPIGFAGTDKAEYEAFGKLQTYLLSQEVQDKMQGLGRRTGKVGLNVKNPDTSVFNPAWGIDVNRIIQPIVYPEPAVIMQALNLYQGGGVRKPSVTAFVVDYSGSMGGAGEKGLEEAMTLLLTPETAKRYMIEFGPKDLTIVIPFNNTIEGVNEIVGNKPDDLQKLLTWTTNFSAGGGTDFYNPSIQAIEEFKKIPNIENYNVSIVLMTDGKSESSSAVVDKLNRAVHSLNVPVPIYSITFGDADTSQLNYLAGVRKVSKDKVERDPNSPFAYARVFDGTSNLADAFRKVRGYN